MLCVAIMTIVIKLCVVYAECRGAGGGGGGHYKSAMRHLKSGKEEGLYYKFFGRCNLFRTIKSCIVYHCQLNIRLGLRRLTVTNALAYYSNEFITVVKYFIIEAAGMFKISYWSVCPWQAFSLVCCL
jgi:hypothetical protein